MYDYPETFNISTEEEEFYSKQELKYLRRVQKYLLFIGLKDLGIPTYDEEGYYIWDYSRYNNELQDKKYFDAETITLNIENKTQNGKEMAIDISMRAQELRRNAEMARENAKNMNVVIDEALQKAHRRWG